MIRLSLICLLGIGCSFEGGTAVPVGDAPDAGQPDAETTATRDAGENPNSACEEPLTLRAAAFPGTEPVVDRRDFAPPSQLTFQRPETISVADGNSGAGCAFLDYVAPDGTEVRCGYRGAGDRFEVMTCRRGWDAKFFPCHGMDTFSDVNHQPITATTVQLASSNTGMIVGAVGTVTLDGTCSGP